MYLRFIAFFCLASFPAFSQESNVTSISDSAKIGAEFRGELKYDDRGFEEYTGHEVSPSSKILVNKLRVNFAGKINPNVDYNFRFDMLGSELLQHGYGTYNMEAGGIKLGLSIGKMKVHQGGWDHRLSNHTTHVQGYYAKHFAISPYQPMVALAADLAGKVTLQVLNDVTTDDTGEWNTTPHPTAVVSWYGKLGLLEPNLEYGTYDNNKSSWLGVGLKTVAMGVTSTVDYKSDRISNKVQEGDKAKSKEDTAASLTVKVAYSISGAATPWIYYSSYEKSQFSDSASGKKDAQVNAASFNKDGKFVHAVDDNAQVLGLGADLTSFGSNWVPFIYMTSTTAKFADVNDVNKEETKTANTVALGCYGTI